MGKSLFFTLNVTFCLFVLAAGWEMDILSREVQVYIIEFGVQVMGHHLKDELESIIENGSNHLKFGLVSWIKTKDKFHLNNG